MKDSLAAADLIGRIAALAGKIEALPEALKR